MHRSFLLVLLLWFCAPAIADDAKQFFDSLYAPRVKQVKATLDRADDLALAKEILGAARTIESDEARAIMCDNVVDLTQRHPDGLAVAVDAQTLLAEKAGPRQADARKKLIELLMRQSTMGDAKSKQDAAENLIALLVLQGDEAGKGGQMDDSLASYRQALSAAQRVKSASIESIKSKIETVSHRSRVEKQIARLREKLLADANDTATAEEIVRLHVVDMDNPAEAMKHLDRAKDAKLLALVPLAAKPYDNASEADSKALGEWYFDLASSAAGPAKEAMWLRAEMNLKRYLDTQPTDALSKSKAELQLKAIQESLAKADAGRAPTVIRTAAADWISKDATYKTSSNHEGHQPTMGLLTGGDNLQGGEYAFHTDLGKPNGNIVIDLVKTKEITRLWIENRRNVAQERAKGITVSLALDTKDRGRIIWTAKEVAKEWTIELPTRMKARYITIQQAERSTEPLHLAQVKIFGVDDTEPGKTAVKPGNKSEVPLKDRPVSVIHTWGNQGIAREVSINAVKLKNSFQSHPSSGRPSQVAFELDGEFEILQGAIGVNDASGGPVSDLTFKIVGDGTELWSSKPTRRKGVVQVFRVSVKDIKKVELFVHCTDDGNAAAVWVEPALYVKASAAPDGQGRKFAGIPLDDKAK